MGLFEMLLSSKVFFKIFMFVILLVLKIQIASTETIQEKLETYEQYVNTSQMIDREEKIQIKNCSEELQLKLVDVTTKYRLQMTRHQQHSFRRRPSNEKWQECLRFYHNATTKLEQAYYVRENGCLREATSADGEKRQAVTQVGREMRKWRRTYRYLMNRCHTSYPDDEELAGNCLVKYMERDNFSYAFQRLINLRLEAVREWEADMSRSLLVLEDCLKASLSDYLERVRSTMDVLSKCYEKSE